MRFGAKVRAGVGAKITAVREDANFSRIGLAVKKGSRGLRAGAGDYLLNKIPIYRWIPAYVPVWLLGDMAAGTSVGLVLFSQAVMFSALAGLPAQAALTASWLPGIFYAAMGTSKDMTIGPVFMPSIVVAGFIKSMSSASNAEIPPVLVAAALSMCVGIWSLLMGLLNLGFLFDSLSVPIVLGFTCGMAIVAYVGQFAPLFGLVGVSPMLVQFTSQFTAKLRETNLAALALGAGSIVFLVAVQKVEKKWSGRHQALRLLTANRNLFVLLISILISYMVNLGRQEALWLAVGPIKTRVSGVQGLNIQFVQGLFLPSFILWIGIAVEHVIVAKALARTRGYAIDPSQELVHLGISNIANSFIGGLPVGGGDMSRAGVSATSGVRSPLSGLFVAAVVVAGMYPLSGFVALLPLPAVAAVIIVAVIDVMPSPGEMIKYWKWSFTDFATFLITFNTTLIVTPEIGLEIGGGILALYTLFRAILSRPRTIQSSDLESQWIEAAPAPWERREEIPSGVCVMRLQNDLIFANAERTKKCIVDTAMTMHSAIPDVRSKNDRAWNDCRHKHVQYLRRRAGIGQIDLMLPRLRAVVLDFSSVSFIDSSGLHAIQDIKSELRAYGGKGVEFRFVGLNDAVQARFKRAAWTLAYPYDKDQTTEDGAETPADYLYYHLPDAIRLSNVVPNLDPLTWETDNDSITNEGQWPLTTPRNMV